MWRDKWSRLRKPVLHTSHLNGLSGLWLLRWRRSESWRLNCLPQVGHENHSGFSWCLIWICLVNLSFLLKNFLQSLHSYFGTWGRIIWDSITSCNRFLKDQVSGLLKSSIVLPNPLIWPDRFLNRFVIPGRLFGRLPNSDFGFDCFDWFDWGVRALILWIGWLFESLDFRCL